MKDTIKTTILEGIAIMRCNCRTNFRMGIFFLLIGMVFKLEAYFFRNYYIIIQILESVRQIFILAELYDIEN